jgi:PAS domain S-box-containing protein
MLEVVTGLFDPSGFTKRAHCGPGWTDGLIALNAVSDLFIWLAYVSIPLVLLYFTRRRDLPYPRLFVLFALFILACGFTHFMDAMMFEFPLYRFAGVLKAATAAVSWATVIALIQVIPRVMPAVVEASAAGGGTKLHTPITGASRGESWRAYIVAILVAVLALLVRASVDALPMDDHIFVVALLGVVYVGWQYGFRPALLTLAIATAGYAFFFMAPRRELAVTGLGNQLALALFFFCGVACAALGESQRVARRRARTALAVALARQEELEGEVARRRAVEAALRLREGELVAARDRADEALARLDAFIDNAPLGIAFFDPDLRYERINAFLAASNGRPVAEHLGRPLLEVLPQFPADQAARYADIAAGAAGVYAGTVELVRPDTGAFQAWQVTAFPVRRPGGQNLGAGVVVHEVTEQRKAERELRRSEARFRRTLDELATPVILYADDGEVLMVNKAWTEATGYTRADVPTIAAWTERAYGADRDAARAYIDRLYAITGRVDDGEWTLTTAGGARRVWHFYTTQVGRESGGRRLVVSTAIDVTEQKRAAAELARQARATALRADVASALAAARDTRSALQACAAVLVRSLGAAFARVWTTDAAGEWLTLQASAGLYTHTDGAHGRVRVGDLKIGRIAAANAPHLTNDVPNDPNTGDPGWAAREGMRAFAGYPLAADGRVLGVLALFARHELPEDVLADLGPVAVSVAQYLDRRQAAEAVLESESRFRTLADVAPALIWVAEPDGRRTYFNRTWLEFTGRTAAASAGSGWADDVHPHDRAGYLAAYHGAVERRQPFELEYRLRRHDGEYRWVLARGVPRAAGDGFAGFVGLCLDVTDRREAAERVVEANQFLEATIDALSSHIAVLAPDGTILKVNAAWRRFGAANGLVATGAGVGRNYLDDAAAQCPSGEPLPLADRILAVIAGSEEAYQVEYPYHSPAAERWFLMRVNRFPGAGPVRVVVAHEDITSRVKAEQEVRASEAFRRSVFDNSPDCLKVIDLDGRLEEMNAAGCALLELDDFEPLRGSNWADLWPAANRETVREALAAVRAGRVARFQGFCSTAAGTPKFWDVSAAPLPGPDGAPRRVLAVSRDVTEQRRAEERVRESEELFRQLAESIPQLAWMTDPDGYIFWYNQRWYEYTGTTLEDMKGWGWERVHDPVELERMLPRWKAALAAGTPWEDTFPLRGRDGTFRWFLSRAHPIRDPLGNIVRWFGTNTDVSAQRALEQTLRASEQRFRTLTEAVPQVVWTADPHGDVTFFNRRWDEYTGVSLAAGRAAGWALELVHPDDGERLRAGWQLAVAQAADEYSEEFRLRRTDGAYRWFLSNALPLRDPAGGVAEWVGTLTDIDDQKRQTELLEGMVRERTAQLEEANAALTEEVHERQRAEEQVRSVAAELERSNGELEKFAYIASHDLQEPLRKIQAFGDRLSTRSRAALDDRGKEYIDRMQGAAARMRQLIDDLLQFARVTTQQRPFRRLELTKLVQEVVSDLDIRIGQAGGKVVVGPLPAIDADPTQMRQLFQNLIANAVKFQRPGVPPVVQIAAEVGPAEGGGAPVCRITVRDNGIGFDDKYKDRIFGVFQRLHGRDEYEGTGVGLAICKKIAERHGGAIDARGRPGEGATFVITLPTAHAPAHEGTDTDARPDQTDHDPDGR